MALTWEWDRRTTTISNSLNDWLIYVSAIKFLYRQWRTSIHGSYCNAKQHTQLARPTSCPNLWFIKAACMLSSCCWTISWFNCMSKLPRSLLVGLRE
jgi:hypothetical protein